MISLTIKQTRTAEDFAWHIHATVQTGPTATWVIVLDNQEDLTTRLLDFIGCFNKTIAQPFQWNCTGRRVSKEAIKRPNTWKENWAKQIPQSLTSALVTQQL